MAGRRGNLLELCRYVALNPVRAHVVAAPEDFSWSSYRATAGIDKAPSFLVVDWLLAQFSPNMKRAERPSLSDLTSGLTTAGKTERNKVIHEAHVRYGYTLKEIADQLGIHYATVSRIVKKMGEINV